MPLNQWPAQVLNTYEVHEWRHATAILATEFPQEFAEIAHVLANFQLTRTKVLTPGGRKSVISTELDSSFYAMGWAERKFNTGIIVDGYAIETPTHKVDCFKNRVAFEIEWNNKTEFYDRDLNNFRLLFDLRVISVGVILTRATHLQNIFNMLGKGDSYGPSSTHMDKLVPRIFGGSAGGCPVVVFGITERLYDDNL